VGIITALQNIRRQRHCHNHKSSSSSNIIFHQHCLQHSGTKTTQLTTGCITGNNNLIAAARMHHHPPLPSNIKTNISTTIHRSRYTSTNMLVPNFSGCKTSQGNQLELIVGYGGMGSEFLHQIWSCLPSFFNQTFFTLLTSTTSE